MTIDIVLDGKKIEAQAGQSILQVAKAHGVRIPTLCYHKDLSPSGNCRMCVVEIEGSRMLQAACVAPVSKGMTILTQSKRVREDRRLTLGLMLANHTANCSYCDISGECELQDLVQEYEVDAPAWGTKGTRYPIDSDPNKYIHVDLNKCILCRRCVQACAEIQVRDVWGIANRGFGAQIVAGAGSTLEEARCEWCGQCVAYCPTGSLSSKVDYGQGVTKSHQLRKVTTTCGHCGIGCRFDLVVRRNRIVGVSSNPEAPVNGMALCVKGRFQYGFVHHPERLLRPRVRRYLLEGGRKSIGGRDWDWVETTWPTALDITAGKLNEIQRERGGGAVGFLSSGKCLNEENYLLAKLARQVFGTNNVDNYARRDHSGTFEGLAACFGTGATSNSLVDIAEQARAVLVIGSNTTEQHPVFGARLRRAVRYRGAKLIVADPRVIELTEFAALHLRHRPGTDGALLNGLMNIILEKEWEDRDFIARRTEGFERLRPAVLDYPPTRASLITGVPVSQLYEAADILHSCRPAAVVCGRGIALQGDGVRNAMDLANLQLLLGNMGVAGGGIAQLLGQNNAQGASDMGAQPGHLPGWQDVNDPGAQAKFAAAWGLMLAAEDGPDSRGPRPLALEPGLSADEMLRGALDGQIGALYVVGEDPVSVDLDERQARDALASLAFLAVQDILPTETAAYADVLLPGASFAEKSGTFTNTERRVQYVQQAVPTAGEAQPDWWIISEIAKRLRPPAKESNGAQAPYAGWNYAGTDEVMSEIRALTPSYAGISHRRLGVKGLQWPCPDDAHQGTQILHVESFVSGRARFSPADVVPPPEEQLADLQVG